MSADVQIGCTSGGSVINQITIINHYYIFPTVSKFPNGSWTTSYVSVMYEKVGHM